MACVHVYFVPVSALMTLYLHSPASAGPHGARNCKHHKRSGRHNTDHYCTHHQDAEHGCAHHQDAEYGWAAGVLLIALLEYFYCSGDLLGKCLLRGRSSWVRGAQVGSGSAAPETETQKKAWEATKDAASTAYQKVSTVA